MEEDKKNESLLPRESVVRHRKDDEEEVLAEEEKQDKEQWEAEGGAVREQPTTEELVSEPIAEPDTASLVSEPIAEPVAEEVVPEVADEPVGEEVQPEKVKDQWFDDGEFIASVTFTPEPEPEETAATISPMEGWTVSNTVNTVVQTTVANVEPEPVRTVILKDDNETFNAYYKKFVYLSGIAVILIMLGVILTKAFSDYEIKPNYAPETAREDVSPGELIRRQLDPRTHFPRQPEVIRKERRERNWNNMSYWQRFKYYLGVEDER